MDDAARPPAPDLARSGGPREPDRSATERERALEDIVAEFIFRREEGGSPAVEEYLARYPRFAEDLAFLLADEMGATPHLTIPEVEGGAEELTGPIRTPGPLRRVGPYEILEQIAQGGGGTVYRARHHDDHHIVALKVLDRFGVADPRDLERFQREAKMLRTMDLVSIVPVYAVGEDDGRLWIAMKWIEGQTLVGLRDAVKDGDHPLHDLRERARLVARVARTFGAVHGYGILHRDVKPSNVMVDRLLEPVVIDFGIARAPDAADLTVTLDGPMGTPRYLAPELIGGGHAAISPQVDIYGLGLCLYELVTGVQAFFQKSRADLFTQIQRLGPPDPWTLNASVPFALNAIILRAIEIDPRRRYASMNDFASDLERFARAEMPDAVTMRRAHPVRRFLMRHRRRVAGVAIASLAAIAMIAWGVGWIRREWRVRELDAVVSPWAFAPPEALPADHAHLLKAAVALRNLAPDRPEIGMRSAWIHFQCGDYAKALQLLGDKVRDEPPPVGLLRDYLSLLAHRADLGTDETARTTSTVPDRTNVDGKGFGDRFDAEVLEGRDFTPEEDARRLLLMPPFRRQVGKVLSPATAAGEAAASHAITAVILWQSLPSGLTVEEAGDDVSELEAAVAATLAAMPGLPWPRFLRAGARLLYGKPAETREDLESLARDLPDVPAVAHLRALAHARPFTTGGDADLASREFRRAADGYEHDGLPRAKGVLAREPLRKLYGAWSLHEIERGRVVEAAEVLTRWEQGLGEPAWQDRAFPLILRARLEETAGRAEAAVDLLREAHKANPKYSLPLREAARLLEHVLHDDDKAEHAASLAARVPMQAPASVESWIKDGFFGLRPYCLKRRFASGFEPLRQRQELAPSDGR